MRWDCQNQFVIARFVIAGFVSGLSNVVRDDGVFVIIAGFVIVGCHCIALDSLVSGLGSSQSWGHCNLCSWAGHSLNSHSASLLPDV